MMKFSKLFSIYHSDEHGEHYIVFEDVYAELKKYDDKLSKSNLKRSLLNFQGGRKDFFEKESVSVFSVLKYLFVNASSKHRPTIVVSILRELTKKENIKNSRSSLELYKLIAKLNPQLHLETFNAVCFDEENIPSLIKEHKSLFTDSEWTKICWFENDFSNNKYSVDLDISYEEVIDLKYREYENLLNVINCSKRWTERSKAQIRKKQARFLSAEQDNQVKIVAGQTHIAPVLDEDLKSLAQRLCGESVEQAVVFNTTQSCDPCGVWAALFVNNDLPVEFEDLCSRIFFSLKRKHSVYVERILLISTTELKTYVDENGQVYRFHLRDDIEINRLPHKSVLKSWFARTLVDGTIETLNDTDIQCEECSDSILSRPLSLVNFNISYEWYSELPVETQILLESFISSDSVRQQTDKKAYLEKKLERLYAIYDTLLNIRNKKFIGVYQKDNSTKLLTEYKSVASVFEITSSFGLTSSLKQADNQLKASACKDLCYYNAYLKQHDIKYETVTGESKTHTNIRSCHVILMLDNLVRLKYIADPNPGEHRSKQLCTLPITLQGLPLDSKVTESWHLSECDGSQTCVCKRSIQLNEDDIQHTLLEPTEEELINYRQFFNLMTFGYTGLWKNLPDELLEHSEGRSVMLDTEDDVTDEQHLGILGINMESEPDSEEAEEGEEFESDLVGVLESIDVGETEEEIELPLESDLSEDEEFAEISKLETSMQHMSLVEENNDAENATQVTSLLHSFGFDKNVVPPLLTRHPQPAIGRDDDPLKIKEILDDVLVKMGYVADPNSAVNRILCGPDNKIGKCLLNIIDADTKYKAFLPEFPVLHLRKSKINILFSSYKQAGLIEMIKYMRDEQHDDWTTLISIAHIDIATKHIKRVALALHMAFLISFMDYIEPSELHEFLHEMDTENASVISSKWADKFQEFLSHGCSRSPTFELHYDLMKHCDEVVAIDLAERLGGHIGYSLLLCAVKSSLLYSFVNNASAYAPYCVKLLHSHYSAGFFHQNLKEELFSTPFKSSRKNFGTDTKREMDHLDALKGFRSGSTVPSATCRMSLIDSLNETKGRTEVATNYLSEDKLGWELAEGDTAHIYPLVGLILRRQGLSLQESQLPYNVYSKVPLQLPSSILDSCSLDVGKYLLMKFLRRERMYNLKNCSSDQDICGPQELVSRAKRSKGTTIKRVIQSKVHQVRSERQTKEDKRQEQVSKEVKRIDCFSSENNACQALVKADSSKPKVLKSIGIQRALISVLQKCRKTESLGGIIELNLTSIPQSIKRNMKLCAIEFAGVKFKVGNIKSGKEYLKECEKIINNVVGRSDVEKTVVVSEEKYGFTPDEFKAGTRQQRQRKINVDVNHLKTKDDVITDTIYQKDLVTQTEMGKKCASTYLAQNVDSLNIDENISLIVDSEYIIEKDCSCCEDCNCVHHCVPLYRKGKGLATKVTEVKQRKGEAEMAIADWLVSLQHNLLDGDAAVSIVTSGDIDAVYIHMFVVNMYWPKSENNQYKFPVYVVLQKPGGKIDVYNITSILMQIEEFYKDNMIGCKLAMMLCIGGNDFIPKFHGKSHQTICNLMLQTECFRNELFVYRGDHFYINKDLYLDFVKQLYAPKRLTGYSVSYEDIRAATISKVQDGEKKSGFKTNDPRKWLPPKSCIERLSDLIQLQIDYLHTAGKHDAKPLNYLQCKTLEKNADGDIEYNFGLEAHFQSFGDLPSRKVTTLKRTLNDTPQKGARRKRPLTSTPHKI